LPRYALHGNPGDRWCGDVPVYKGGLSILHHTAKPGHGGGAVEILAHVFFAAPRNATGVPGTLAAILAACTDQSHSPRRPKPPPSRGV